MLSHWTQAFLFSRRDPGRVKRSWKSKPMIRSEWMVVRIEDKNGGIGKGSFATLIQTTRGEGSICDKGSPSDLSSTVNTDN